MNFINEGLMKNDLAKLVLPIMSIDEYDSKIKDDAIVVAFYVTDKDPATDLNKFIQKSPVMLLDTEVSPAPNQDGFYLVFVEMDRSDMFKLNLHAILKEIDSLVDIDLDQWKFTVYGHDSVFELNDKNIDVLVRTKSYDDLKADLVAESINKFFADSMLKSVFVDYKNNLTLTGNGIELTGIIDKKGNVENSSKLLGESALQLNTLDSALLEKMLGPNYYVTSIENKLVIVNPAQNILVIKENKFYVPF